MNWEESVQWMRARPDMRASVLASYYDDPLLGSAQRYSESEEWKAILQYLPNGPGARALDVGAGRGIASFALAKNGFEVTALEPDDSELVGAAAIRSLARESRLPIRVVQGLSEDLPLGSDEFDLVFGRAVLHHTRDLPAACEEYYRVLKPGGVFVAVREHVISRAEDLETFLRRHELHFLYEGENAFTLDHYIRSIRHAGFDVDRVLAPLRSPINLAPHTQASFRSELARRASFGRPALARAFNAALTVRGCWPLIRLLMERIDNRPGRLYSFVAHRPM